MERAVIRAVLLAAIIISIGAILAPLWIFGYGRVEVWNTVAASLAVITAVISAWITQTLFERQENALRPYPYPILDPYSRTNLFQLRVANMGGSTAYDISLKWDKPLLDVEGNPIRFSQVDPEIPILLPNASVAVLIGVANQFLNKYKNGEYSGEVEFKEYPGSNKVLRHKFFISSEMYRRQLVYTSEEQETHDKLQKLPDEISKITYELKELRHDLNKSFKPADDDKMLRDVLKKAKELGDPIPNLPGTQD